MRLVSVVRGSRTYRAVRTVRRWAEGSVVVALLGRERVQKALVGLLVLVSVVSVLGSNLGSAIKFLSFMTLFVAIAAIALPLAESALD